MAFPGRQDVDLSVADQLRALRGYAENNGYVVACRNAHITPAAERIHGWQPQLTWRDA